MRNLIVNKKKNFFFYFDTHIVNSKFRGKKVYKGLKISDLHMDKIKNFLKNKNILSMLLCKRSKLNYYRNSGWQRIFKSNYELNLKKKNLYLLIYPKQKNLYYTKYFI